MDPVTNPFAPGAGSPPPELSGRHHLLDGLRIAFERVKAGRHAKSLIAVGLRGVGKTVLLREARSQAEAAGFVVAAIELQEGRVLAETLIPHLRRILLDLDRSERVVTEVKRGLRVLKSFLGAIKLRYGEAELALDIDPEKGTADSGSLEADLPELFAALGAAAKARGRPVALFLDELQYLSKADFGALIMALHRCAQDQLPVMMVAAGLPQVVALSGRSKSYAERMFDFPELGPLNREDADTAVAVPAEQQGVTVSPAALDAIHGSARGYPYFIQEWAYHAWNAADDARIDAKDVRAGDPIARERLDGSFFRVRFDRLTPREKDYLRAMADVAARDAAGDTVQAGEIAARLGVKATSVAPLRSGLIAKGMIYSPRFGDTAFTVPLFGDVICRVMPDWVPRQSRS